MENWIKKLKEEDPTFLHKGYICLPRSILNELFSPKRARRHQARVFTALLIKANYTAGEVLYKEKKVYCREGELIISPRLLSGAIEVHYSKIQRTLDKLQQENFIEIISKYDGQHIRINNYKEITNPVQNEFARGEKKRSKQIKSSPPAGTAPDRVQQEALEENRRILEEALKRK